jgi:hypothetical protein
MANLKKLSGQGTYQLTFDRKPQSGRPRPYGMKFDLKPYSCMLSERLRMPKWARVDRCWIGDGFVKFGLLGNPAAYNQYYLYSVLKFDNVHDALEDVNTGIWHSFYDYFLSGYKHYYMMPILTQSEKDGRYVIRTKTTTIVADALANV